ncbi:hypothetical protein EC9_51210 [Rosistilla ulvae]|uniref:Sulfatase n=1 Tax=Rosistilla ulvae TaxID=1930277 RepID=A0A517M7Q3_9BACT|nr:hypothetical protein [Rosistilla ulvae]QDS90903.1 hypothetical protein EC9_51210 [Rosistilla ulvae]
MPPRAVVLSIDGLAPASLQPYGCSWQPTPNFNRLAATSLVFERCYADSLDPIASLCSMLSGTHSAAGASSTAPFDSTGSTLITDSPAVGDLPLAKSFENQIVVPFEVPAAACEEVEETSLANLFAAGIDAISDSTQKLCWLHASSLPRCWDAPRSLCHADDELQLPTEASPPQSFDPAATEPDQMLGWMTVYGGQVRLLDMLLGVLVDSITASPGGDETLLIVTGTGGMSLGENDRFGLPTDDYRSAALHVPLILRIPRQDPLRSLRICQPWEIASTIDGWLQQMPQGLLTDATPAGWTDAQSPVNWALATDADGAVASFQTPWWNLCGSGTEAGLFRKPDDRFDSNDIASRVPEVAELLRDQAELALQSLQTQAPRHELSPNVVSGHW